MGETEAETTCQKWGAQEDKDTSAEVREMGGGTRTQEVERHLGTRFTRGREGRRHEREVKVKRSEEESANQMPDSGRGDRGPMRSQGGDTRSLPGIYTRGKWAHPRRG